MVKIGEINLGEFPLLLAPMEDVSDPPFRALCKKYGADVMYTEFISSEGLIRDATKSVQKLDIFEYERPVGIQIFGADVESMKKATELCEKVNPDIIDINYGCPVKKVACKGAGAGILQDIPKMVSMTKAIVDSTHLPVTVKTRLGWDDNTKYIVETAERLQDVGIKAISIHGRTRSQMYKGEADWTLISEVKNNPRMHIPVFGNGDVDSPQKAVEYFMKYGYEAAKPTLAERVKVVLEHLDFSIKWKGDRVGIVEMRRHYANYFKGIPNFKPIRNQLVTLDDKEELYAVIKDITTKFDVALV